MSVSRSSESSNLSSTASSAEEPLNNQPPLSEKAQQLINKIDKFCIYVRNADFLSPFVDPNYLGLVRKGMGYLCRVSLVSELIDYPPFQVISTAEGYRSIGIPINVRWPIAVICGGLFDTYSNVRSANVANDSFDAAINFFAKSELPTLMGYMLVFAQLCSLISFLYGASGNMVGLMWAFLLVCQSPWQALYYGIFSVSCLFTILPGIAYYAIFNIVNFISSFEMFVDFMYADKRDLNGFNARTFAAFLESINIIVFRSISFGAIGDEALKIAFRDNPPKGSSAPIVETGVSSTAISVLTTRVVKVILHYSKNEFLVLTPDEMQAARQALGWGEYIASIVMSRNMLVSTVSASGLGLLLNGFLGMKSTLAISLVCAIPFAFLALNIFSQADLVVLNKAVEIAKGLDEPGFEERLKALKNARKNKRVLLAGNPQHLAQQNPLQAPLVDNPLPLSNLPEAKAKKGQEMAKELFDHLKEPFEKDPWIKYAVPTIAIVQIVFARAISFLFFADTLEAYTPLEYSGLGLLLFAGAPNVANMIDMFESNMKNTLLSRRAELYVLYCEEMNNVENPPTFHEWQPSFATYQQLFCKGAVDYSPEQVKNAIVRMDKDQTLVYTDYPSAIFQRAKAGFADLPCFRTIPLLAANEV